MVDPVNKGQVGPKSTKFPATPSSWSNLESNGVSVTLVTNSSDASSRSEDTPHASNGLTITSRGENLSKIKRSFPITKEGMGMLTALTHYNIHSICTMYGFFTIMILRAAQCENCGRIGVKHAFYTKKRNFCSLQCSKASFRKNEAEKKNTRIMVSGSSIVTFTNLHRRIQFFLKIQHYECNEDTSLCSAM